MGPYVLIGIYTTIFILLVILCLVPRLLRKYGRVVTRQEWQLDMGQKGEFSTITTFTNPPSSATSTLQHDNLDIHELLNIKFKFRSTGPHGRRRQRRDRGRNPSSSANPTAPRSHTTETPQIYTKGENDSTESGVSHEGCLVDPEGIRQQKVVPVSESSFPVTSSSHSAQAPLANTQKRGNDRESFIMHPARRPVRQQDMEACKTIPASEVVQCCSPSNEATYQYTAYPVFSCFNGTPPPQTKFNCKCACKKWYPGSHREVDALVASEISESFPSLKKVTGKFTPSVATCFEGPGSCIALPLSHEIYTLPKSVSHDSFPPLNGVTYTASSPPTYFESLPPSQTKTNPSKLHKVYPGSCLVLPRIPHDAVPRATSHEQFPPLHHHPAPGSNPVSIDAAFKESGISSGLWGVFKERQRSRFHPDVSQDELNNIYDVPPTIILPVAALSYALQCEAGRGGGEEKGGLGEREEEEKGERGNAVFSE